MKEYSLKDMEEGNPERGHQKGDECLFYGNDSGGVL
jgi:hypothetical protein